MRNPRLFLRPDLQVILKEGSHLVIKRSEASGAENKITLQPGEWQELIDWVRSLQLLSEAPGNIA